MGCNCNKGAKKVAPIKKSVNEEIITSSNNKVRVANSVRRIIKKPLR